jgi:hypothetical protein
MIQHLPVWERLLLVLGFCLVFISGAEAKDFELKWTPSTTFDDANKTPLPVGAIAEYRVYEGSATVPIYRPAANSTAQTVFIPDVGCSIKVYTMAAVTIVELGGRESNRSNPAILMYGCGAASPTNLTIMPK